FNEASSRQCAKGHEGIEIKELFWPQDCHRRQHEYLPISHSYIVPSKRKKMKIVVGRLETEMLTNEAGDVTSHFNTDIFYLMLPIQYHIPKAFYLLMLVVFSFTYVFDGQPPDLKKQKLTKRHFIANYSNFTQRRHMLLRICKILVDTHRVQSIQMEAYV
ncbi:hypothetical protein Gotur_032207, partial [Gossypium turneri]